MIRAPEEAPSVLVLSESQERPMRSFHILNLVKVQPNLLIQRVIILFVDYPDAPSPLFLWSFDHHLSISLSEEKLGHLKETRS